MSLYPLKFIPILKPAIWGGKGICEFKNINPHQQGIGESWEISGVDGSISVVGSGSLQGKSISSLIDKYKGQLVGDSVYKKFGNKFPLLIKFIDAAADLSVQVHPNDKMAMERHQSFGKTEMWYVVNAKENASLYCGFSKQIAPHSFKETLDKGLFIDSLEKHDIKAGDVFYLPAGRVHAIGAGIFVAEIQQASNITYRIYDYNRKDAHGQERELHTELAKDAIDFTVYDNHKKDYLPQKDEVVLLQNAQYFTTNLIDLEHSIKRDYKRIDSFVIYVCLEGECSVVDDRGNIEKLKQGESILFPANTQRVDINPHKTVKLLETYI